MRGELADIGGIISVCLR